MSIRVCDPGAAGRTGVGDRRNGQSFASFLFRRSGWLAKRRMTSEKMGHTNRLIGPDNTR